MLKKLRLVYLMEIVASMGAYVALALFVIHSCAHKKEKKALSDVHFNCFNHSIISA